MKALLKTLSITLLLTATPVLATAHVHKVANPIPGQYLVVYKSSAVRPLGASVLRGPNVRELASTMALAHNAVVRRNFEHALNGSVMQMSAAQAEALAKDPRVAYVEQDSRIRTAGTEANPPSWGLDRIDQRDLPLNDSYSYSAEGVGVEVYVVDTGIRSTHLDFGGRVDTADGYTTIADGYGTEDCNGHGTFVAGVIGGSLFGVAKGVTLHPVRVLACDGSGSSTGLIDGIDWIIQDAEAHGTTTTTTTGHGKHAVTTTTTQVKPTVINISIEGPAPVGLQNGVEIKLQDGVVQAIQSAVDAGITVVVAAGNDNGDACNFSPADSPVAITVSGSNETDGMYPSSNTGSCVDLFAPAENVTSDWDISDTSSAIMSGTSAAAPHVAGEAALYLAANPTATPAEVKSAILSQATANVLTGVPSGTSNLLLYSGAPAAPVDAPPTAAFTYSCKGNGSCAFDASGSSDDHGIVRYDWDFGDGWSGVGIAPSHAYASHKGTATVTLTVTDTAGQTDSVSQNVTY